MNLSHKLTFSLACVFLLLAFSIMPVLAHEAPEGQTFEEAHDGLAADGTPLDATTTPTLDTETGHTHKTSVPTVTLALQDNMVGTDSSVKGAEVRLIADLAADPLVFTDLAAASSDTGLFQILVTFSEDVYTNVNTEATADTLTAANADLDADDFTLTAALQSAPTANIAGAGISMTAFARVVEADGTTLSTTSFLVTLTVTNAIIQAESLPIDVWVSVDANAVQTASSGPVLNNGVLETNLGRGNAASMRYKFTIVPSFDDTTAPTLTVPDGTRGADGNVTFTITTDEVLTQGDGALTTDDLTVTGGEIVSLTQDGMVYTLVVMPTDMYTDVSVMITAAGVMDRGGNAVAADVTAMYDAPARPFNPQTGTDGTFRIPANSFLVVVRDADSTQPGAGGLAFRSDVLTAEWAGMPDLQNLFDRTAPHGGGAIILKDADAATLGLGTVGISEIMWGLDNSYVGNETAQQASQWIELHNLNTAAVTVSLTTLMGRDILDAANGLREGLAAPNIDAVTNFFNNRPGNAAWNVKGSSGDSVQARDFVAMGRIRPDSDPGGGVNRQPYADANNRRYNTEDGRHADSWVAFSTTYLVARTSGGAEYKYIGTPGRVNDFVPQTQNPNTEIVRTRQFKPASNNIVINEVGNNSEDKYDWIEIRNASGGEINLRNYLITKVTAVGTEDVMARFPANDNIKLQSNEVFLLLRTDPAEDSNHPIAATGRNVDKPDAEQVPGTPNSPVRYKVYNHAPFSIPNTTTGNGPEIVIMVRRPDSGHNNGPGQHGGQGTSEIGANQDLDKIVDIAGYHSNLTSAYPNPVSNTHLWPLYAFDRPNFTNNRFDVNTVHQRNRTSTHNDRSGVGAQDNANDHRTAFGNRGWTGVGYRRHAAQTAANGGTPGYPNGASPRAGDVRNVVYISEIMYADDARGSLAQWIELRNPSNTMGADLTNWRLTITNHDSKNEAGDAFTGTTHAEILLNGLEIPPNSAVLITSRQGPRADVQVPDDHIFVLYPKHRNAFGMTNATSDILNPYGFNIRLQANAHDTGKRHEWQDGDEVGNLAARRDATRGERTDTERYDDPRWMLPHAMTENGERISIARTNKPGGTKATGFTVASGKEASGWILSNMDTRTDLVSPTYYGHRDDWSTPGQTVGQPLPVELSYFRPTLENGKVTIRWTTESELENAGFNILRSETRDGEFTQVNEQMIQGKGTTAERTTYKWVDTTAKPGAVYYYQIEDVSFAGQRTPLAITKLKGLISAKGKLTTQWGDLKNLR